MVKRLGLLRHAKSDWDDLSTRDFDRGLNDRGKRGAALMGAHILDLCSRWDRAIASPAERVKRTLEASGIQAPVQFEDEAYLADCTTLLRLISQLDDEDNAVLVAAHNPGLQELALALAGDDRDDAIFAELETKFPTCAFALFELDIDEWADTQPGCGRLVHFARPRDLDPELGPLNVS